MTSLILRQMSHCCFFYMFASHHFLYRKQHVLIGADRTHPLKNKVFLFFFNVCYGSSSHLLSSFFCLFPLSSQLCLVTPCCSLWHSKNNTPFVCKREKKWACLFAYKAERSDPITRDTFGLTFSCQLWTYMLIVGHLWSILSEHILMQILNGAVVVLLWGEH